MTEHTHLVLPTSLDVLVSCTMINAMKRHLGEILRHRNTNVDILENKIGFIRGINYILCNYLGFR